MFFGWLKKKQPELEPAPVSEAVGKIIADYGEFLENNPMPGVIRDERHLPHKKELILFAIRSALASQDCPSELRSSLTIAALALAQFQKDVGDDIHPLGIDMAKLAKMDAAEGVKLLSSNKAGKEKHDRLRPIIEAESARISKIISATNP